MTISEMISAITRKIKDKYPEVTVYKDKVKQGFKTPCFFVTCLNAEQNKVITEFAFGYIILPIAMLL